MRDLGLLAIWDDGDDLYAEPRAPYPHTREVLLQRSQDEGVSVLVAGFARTVEAGHLVASGWADEMAAPRDSVRARAPRVSVSGATDTELARDPFARAARIPSTVHAAIGEGLEHGPVLVQTPRLGLRPRAGLRDLPGPGALRPVRGSAAVRGTAPGAGVHLVWHARRRVDVPVLFGPGAAGRRGR